VPHYFLIVAPFAVNQFLLGFHRLLAFFGGQLLGRSFLVLGDSNAGACERTDND
jgi:hypothetical protein